MKKQNEKAINGLECPLLGDPGITFASFLIASQFPGRGIYQNLEALLKPSTREHSWQLPSEVIPAL